MLEESLIKSNFVGRDGFRWWIGQIPPESSHGGQLNGAGWGNRFKVRIMGYHPHNLDDLPDEDLPWAQVLLSPSDGTGAGNQATSVKISPGDIVFGFFLDGDNAQVPVIIGCFGRTSQVPSNDYVSPFIPFTGYTDKMKTDGAYFVKNQINQQNADAQKSPRNVSFKQAQKIGPNERSAYNAIGDVVKAASQSSTNTVDKISNQVQNFVNKIQTITDQVNNATGNVQQLLDAEISKITATLQKITTGIVNSAIHNLYVSLAPVLNAGLKLLYRTVYALVFAATQSDPIAHRAGVAAQYAMVPPIQAIHDALPCITNSIIGSIGDIIKGLLRSVSENVTNFTTCISEQFIGGLMNNIIGSVTSAMSPLMAGVQSISMGFNVNSFMRSSVDGLLGKSIIPSCNEVSPNYNSQTEQWEIGKGAKEAPGIPIETILETANAANALAESFISGGGNISDFTNIVGALDLLNPNFSVPGFTSPISNCYGGEPLSCGGVKVKIFGSTGTGAVAIPILGSIVGEGAQATGSIVGIDVTDGGSGYDYPPFIEIVDECNRGYGAIARAQIDYDESSPTYKQITGVYVISEGENYPISDVGETPNIIPPYIIDGITIVNPGINYTNNDTVIDLKDPETEYKILVGSGGQIIQVYVINSEMENVKEIKELPEFSVKTETGYGALLKAKLKPRLIPYQGEIKQQIDCITK